MANNNNKQKKSEANITMLQAFEWYLEPDYQHWNRLAEKASEFKKYKIERVWLPPAYKEFRRLPVEPITEKEYHEHPGDQELYKKYHTAINATGYAVYDRYDLGEFPLPIHGDPAEFPTTKATKYGSFDDYMACINAMHEKSIDVVVDIVVNHMFGADALDPDVEAYKIVQRSDRTIDKAKLPICRIEAPTIFTYPERNGKYSDDTWQTSDFNAVGYDEDKDHVFLFKDKEFNSYVDKGKDIKHRDNESILGINNYDYLMGSNIDMEDTVAQEKLIRWLKWYINITKADGIRLDAVKHISYKFLPTFIKSIRSELKDYEYFAVAEHWTAEPQYCDVLLTYLDDIKNCCTLFDVPLHIAMHTAFTKTQEYDLRDLYRNSLLRSRKNAAVTFVDNHDTQSGQMLQSEIPYDYKQAAYALILFQQYGLPCVFYGDLYGFRERIQKEKNSTTDYTLTFTDHKPVELLGEMCKIRKSCAHGEQKDYWLENDVIYPYNEAPMTEQEKIKAFHDQNEIITRNDSRKHFIGYTRAGVSSYKYSGMAVMVNNGKGGELTMHVNSKYAGQKMVNIFQQSDTVTLDDEGNATFKLKEHQKCGVWIREIAYNYIFRVK